MWMANLKPKSPENNLKNTWKQQRTENHKNATTEI